MDRRESLRSIVLGSVAGGLVLNGCTPANTEVPETEITRGSDNKFGRTPEEQAEIDKLHAEQFFNEHELATIAVLSELILPPNEEFGGPLEAEVPDFIEFMAKDIPELQTTLRGGLMWLDHKCNTEYGTEFKATAEAQQKELLDAIAFYDPNIPLSEQPLEIQFFSLMRNLTVCGYYTSQNGIAELGYKGNTANVWDGVPPEVLAKHDVDYDPEWLAKCIDQETRGTLAEWDDEGNLIT